MGLPCAQTDEESGANIEGRDVYDYVRVPKLTGGDPHRRYKLPTLHYCARSGGINAARGDENTLL